MKCGFERGHAIGKLQDKGPIKNRRGTSVSFLPDHQIFGNSLRFKPARFVQKWRGLRPIYLAALKFGGLATLLFWTAKMQRRLKRQSVSPMD